MTDETVQTRERRNRKCPECGGRMMGYSELGGRVWVDEDCSTCDQSGKATKSECEDYYAYLSRRSRLSRQPAGGEDKK